MSTNVINTTVPFPPLDQWYACLARIDAAHEAVRPLLSDSQKRVQNTNLDFKSLGVAGYDNYFGRHRHILSAATIEFASDSEGPNPHKIIAIDDLAEIRHALLNAPEAIQQTRDGVESDPDEAVKRTINLHLDTLTVAFAEAAALCQTALDTSVRPNTITLNRKIVDKGSVAPEIALTRG